NAEWRIRPSSRLTVWPRPPSSWSATSRIGARRAPASSTRLSLTDSPSPLDSSTISWTVARLFDAMADTYDDLEPWYEHLYEVLPYADAHFDAVVCCGSTLSFVDDPARALVELGRVLRPGGRLLLDCEHRPSLDLAWTLGSALAGDALGYGVTPRESWRALNARDGLRLPYPGYGPLWLFSNRQLARLLGAAGLRTVRGWGVHAVTS